jgi:hypothetical protein
VTVAFTKIKRYRVPTNKELLVQLRAAKKEIRELKAEAADSKELSGSLPNFGYGISLDDKGYKIVELKFNVETKQAMVFGAVASGHNTGKVSVDLRTKVIDELLRITKVASNAAKETERLAKESEKEVV